MVINGGGKDGQVIIRKIFGAKQYLKK